MKIVKSDLLDILEKKENTVELPFEKKNRLKAQEVVSEMSTNISVTDFAKLMVKNHLCPSLFFDKFRCREQEYFAARCENCWENSFKYPNNT